MLPTRFRQLAYLPILALLPLILEAQQAPFNYDANGNLLVNVAAGGGAGGTSSTFGAAFPGTGTAAGFRDGGGLMQPGLLDGSNFLEVDCKAGCSGAAGDTTASGTLAAGNNTVVMAMAGVTSASFSLPAASTLVGTVVAEYSTDGGTSYGNSANLRTASGQWASSISVTNTGAAQGWNLQVPGGASHVRVRVSVYTSGTSGANGALLRGVQQPEMVGATAGTAGQAVPNWLVMVGGSDGTNLRALSTDSTGKLNVLASQTGTWTMQPGNTANTTPWLISISQGGNTATVSAGGALKVDGSAVTQPISAASLPLPTGAATAAKQPALGTAGTPSADVITVQGVTSMTALKVDGSGVTQPVSGTVAATQSGTWNVTVNAALPAGSATIGKVDLLGNAGAILDFAGQNAASPANSLMMGCQFNTTPTTITTGNASPCQLDSAGDLLVNLKTAIPAGANTIGAVTQASGPWTINVTQFGSNNVVTGTGASGVGIPRVTVASDSNILATQSGTWTVQPGNTANTTAWLVTGGLTQNGAAAAGNRLSTLPGLAETAYANGTALTQGRDESLEVGTDGLLWTAQLPAIRPASYTASAKFAASSTTDNCVLPGNASDTVLVTEVRVSGIQTTAGVLNLELAKRSTADTAGTSAGMTAVPDDSNYSAAVSAPLSYTGTGPTVGTLTGDIDNAEIGFMATGTASPNDIYVGNFRQKPIVLRGTAQMLTVNLGGAVTGGTMTCTFKWIETTTITP